jgi:hypothetical protein
MRKQGSIDKIPAHTECWRQQLHHISPSQLLGLRMEHYLRNLDQLAGEAVAESHNNCILALRRYCVGLLRHSVRFRDDFKLQTAANLIRHGYIVSYHGLSQLLFHKLSSTYRVSLKSGTLPFKVVAAAGLPRTVL